MEWLNEVLAVNRYPGRGVLWCRTADGSVLGGYFLTGRSPESRARTLSCTAEGDLVVAPTGTGGHDRLRHYVAGRRSGEWLVFGNGEQVAAVADRLAAGQPPAPALDGLDYEPDPPIFTPRLTVVLDLGDTARAWFGAARHSGGERTATNRLTLQAGGLAPGEGVLMTTYQSDGRDIATGRPFIEFRTRAHSSHDLSRELWAALPEDLRIAAAVFTPGALGQAEIRQAVPAQS
ncbi:IMP cyclohydrolase [Streptacidiphilus carbonis]|uniref:IMP cyclohydrolase n=1 Tax=Streptacidiphilus carbonis TaxID=105422 RepID=UPI000A71D6B7|nr:IMP cyclohydrolase [Streptacidiphilus carbonis]